MKTRSRRLDGLAQSPIRTMTRLCSEQGGINLGQGLCQMPTPSVVIAAASEAMKADHNAYSYPEGELSLRYSFPFFHQTLFLFLLLTFCP